VTTKARCDSRAQAEERETFISGEKTGKGEVKLREAKATTLRRVLLAHSCAKGGEDVVGEVKGVEEVGQAFAPCVAS